MDAEQPPGGRRLDAVHPDHHTSTGTSAEGDAQPRTPGPRSPHARRVTYEDVEFMTAILALDLDADPGRWGWGEEPYRSEWRILRGQIEAIQVQGLGVDIPPG